MTPAKLTFATLPPGDRPIIILLALIVASGFWSTAATECFALLFLAAVLVQGSAYREQHRSRELRPETLLQLLFWIVYVATTLVSFYNAPSTTETLPFHMIWHPLLFPALLMLGVRASEVRVLAIVFVASACLAALATLATFPFSNAQHLEAIFTGDTTFFDLLVLAALASVCLALSGNGPPWIFLLAGLPAATAVMLSAERAPVVIMLVGSLAVVLATRPRKAFIWAGIAALLLLLSPQALWMKLDWFFHGHPLDRYPVWMAGLQLVPSTPMFGYGPGSFEALLPTEARMAFIHRPPASWHNDFLQTTLENGWITSLAYIALLLSVIVPALKASMRYASSSNAALAAALSLLLLSGFCCSALGLVISTSVLGTIFWILLALTASVASKDHPHAH